MLTDEQILDRAREGAEDISRQVGRPNKGRSRASVATKHSAKTCDLCKCPHSIKLRAEDDFCNWHSTREIADDLMAKGYKTVSAQRVYRHMVALGFDLKRGDRMERGVARLCDKGFSMLDTGQLSLRGGDLIAALTLWAKLKGMLSDNQAINNILIRNNIPALEDIAKIKDKAELQDRTAQIVKELQDAGAFPGVTLPEAHYNRVKELVQTKIAEKE